MTARAQTRELEHFKSLGANGVIAKPFDPMTLAKTVRGYLRLPGLAALREDFMQRLRTDAAALAQCRATLQSEAGSSAVLQQIQSFAHALVGAAGIFEFPEVSGAASALEQAIIGAMPTGGTEEVACHLDALLACIGPE
jgi:HPt (histidine-containing phosphotransfer) domain-containing protein